MQTATRLPVNFDELYLFMKTPDFNSGDSVEIELNVLEDDDWNVEDNLFKIFEGCEMENLGQHCVVRVNNVENVKEIYTKQSGELTGHIVSFNCVIDKILYLATA